MNVFRALKFNAEREQEFTAAPPACGHGQITAHGYRAFAPRNQRHRRLQRMTVLAYLFGQCRIHFCHFARFARHTVAENHWRDAVLLKKRAGHRKTRMRGRNHAVVHAREHGIIGL